MGSMGVDGHVFPGQTCAANGDTKLRMVGDELPVRQPPAGGDFASAADQNSDSVRH